MRLYGNDPEADKRAFLDEAHKEGLEVIMGMSDYPYRQMTGNCQTTKYNCYKQLKEAYAGNLRNGLLGSNNQYHAAIRKVIVMNEPELKMPNRKSAMKFFVKAMLSAIDGMIDAEKEAGVTGTLPMFTVGVRGCPCATCSPWAPWRGA